MMKLAILKQLLDNRTIPDLKSFLERHAFNYMQNDSGKLKNPFNKISSDIIVQGFFKRMHGVFLKMVLIGTYVEAAIPYSIFK